MLAFCASQRAAFDSAAWERFEGVSKLEVAAAARYLAGVDWYGHRTMLARVADRMTPLNFEQLSQTVDFEPGRFMSMLRALLEAR